LATSGGGELPLEHKFPVWSGKVTALSGWLGAFEVEWRQENPIDLEVCTRCNACLRACPEDAIGYDYQIDLAKCKSHRE
jgi:epoxyqueuosine reductase QueG